MTAAITLDPDPPVAGAQCKVCITGATLPATATVSFPGSSEADIAITWTVDNGGCVTINVPSTVDQMTVTDDSGQAPYRDVPVVPPT